MQNVTINGKYCKIQYTEARIGDTIYDKNTERTYTATIDDVDDIYWIVVDESVPFDFQEFKNFLLNYDECTTEEMERTIELVYQFLNQPK